MNAPIKSNIKHNRWAAAIAAASLGLIASAPPLLAQDAGSFEAITTPPPIGEYRVTLGGGYRTEADFDEGDGKFSEAALRATAAARFHLTERFALAPIVSYQYSHYDFSDLGVGDGTPWEHVHILRGTALFSYEIDKTWTVFGGPSGSIAAEDGADIGDSMSGGALAGFTYNHNEHLSLGAGLGIFSRLEDDVGVLPFILVNWEFAPAWNLRAGFSEVGGNGGLGAEVLYEFAPSWKVGGGIMFQQKRFRLDESEAVVQDRNVPIYAKLAWQATDKINLELVAGVAVGGNLELTNDEGDDEDIDYESSAIVGLRAIFKF